MSSRVLAVFALVLCSLLSGCKKHPKEQADVSAAWDNYVSATQARRGADVAAMVSKATTDHYSRLLGIALTEPAEKVWKLPPTQMYEVLKMRHRFKKSELKGINGKGYILLAVSRGWSSDDDPAWKLTSIRVADDLTHATALVHNPELEKDYLHNRGTHRYFRLTELSDEPPRYKANFVFEDNAWKYDETTAYTDQDADIRALAARFRMSVRDLLMDIEAEDSGEPVRMPVWEPPR